MDRRDAQLVPDADMVRAVMGMRGHLGGLTKSAARTKGVPCQRAPGWAAQGHRQAPGEAPSPKVEGSMSELLPNIVRVMLAAFLDAQAR